MRSKGRQWSAAISFFSPKKGGGRQRLVEIGGIICKARPASNRARSLASFSRDIGKNHGQPGQGGEARKGSVLPVRPMYSITPLRLGRPDIPLWSLTDASASPSAITWLGRAQG